MTYIPAALGGALAATTLTVGVVRQNGGDPLEFQVRGGVPALRLTSDTNAAFAGAVSVAGVASIGTSIELGPTTGPANNTPYIDFRTEGAQSNDYDARLLAYRNDAETGGYGAKGANIQAVGKTLQVVQGTLTATKNTFGQRNDAVVATFLANIPQGSGAEVMGYTPGLGALYYPDFDSVAVYIANDCREPLFVVTGATFSVVPNGAARVLMPPGAPLTAVQRAQLFRGLQLLTNHAPGWAAWVDTWDPAGAWVQVLGGFGHIGGSAAPNQDPTGSPVQGGGAVQVAFGPITKIWGQNTNVSARGGLFRAAKASGYELGLFNYTGAPHTWRGDYEGGTTANGPVGYTWGYDAVNLGPERVGSGFIARGDMAVGFHARGGATACFLADGVHTSNAGAPGFLSTQSSGTAFAVAPGDPGAATTFSVSAAGVVTATSFADPVATTRLRQQGGTQFQAITAVTGAGTDQKNADVLNYDGGQSFRLLKDDQSGATDWLTLLRTGTVATSAKLKANKVTLDGAVVLPGLLNCANDVAAASAGVPVNGLYRNGNVVQIRLS